MLLVYKRARVRRMIHKSAIGLPRHRIASPYVCEWQLGVGSLSCWKSFSVLRNAFDCGPTEYCVRENSMYCAVSSAIALPCHNSTTANAMSMPADTPADVMTR